MGTKKLILTFSLLCHDSLTAGAHTATIPAESVDQMMNKELVLNAIKIFNKHGQELNK